MYGKELALRVILLESRVVQCKGQVIKLPKGSLRKAYSRNHFSKLGLEPWGRIGSGVVELIASVLILFPKTTSLGALISVGVISGALVSHLTKLGIVVMNDGGMLFILALIVFVTSAALVIIFRKQLLNFIPFI